MKNIQSGPFIFEQTSTLKVNGVACARVQMRYGHKLLSERVLQAALSASQIIESFGDDRAAFVRAQQPAQVKSANPLADGVRVHLVQSTETTGEHGKMLGEFRALAPIDGLVRGLIDDRHATWLVSAIGVMPMDSDEFARLKSSHDAIADALTTRKPPAAPTAPRGWIAGLLPDDVLTLDAPNWRAPTAWEIRHVVGAGSFTGITGAQAAALVGVLPPSFRKYTASDGSASRQKMSFAMWHLLLHRVGVQSL